jgi:8-oxo-dGTP pyrophosphatase MutT (NUDIX family)
MKFTDVLKVELSHALPGREAQLNMVPEGRELILTPSEKRDAAVSIIINVFSDESAGEIIFIKRQAYNGPHSDQVSFPGGKPERNDNNLMETAIRECFEEIGLKLKIEKLVGILTPLYISVSKYMVYPYIFIYAQLPDFRTDPAEVSYLIRFPVRELLDEKLKQKTTLEIRDQKFQVPYYAIKNEIVWGATAMILAEFIEILKRIKIKNPGLL